MKICRQFRNKARAVQSRQSRHPFRLQARIHQSDKTGDISGIKHHYHMLHIRTILLDVTAETGSNLGIALEQILASHAGLSRRTAAAHHITCSGQRLLHIGCVSKVHSLKAAVTQLLGHTFKRRLVWVVQAHVRRQAHHQRRLGHIRPDHTGSTDNSQFFISQKIHKCHRKIFRVI